jgi:hypothetical protein
MPIAFPFEAPAEPLCAGSAPQSKPQCKQTLAIPDQASGCRRLFPGPSRSIAVCALTILTTSTQLSVGSVGYCR